MEQVENDQETCKPTEIEQYAPDFDSWNPSYLGEWLRFLFLSMSKIQIIIIQTGIDS